MTLLKRTTHQPQEFTQKQMEGFSLLSHKASAIAITNRLTGSQFRLWHYLLMIDPFADQTKDGERVYHDIPSPAEIGIAIGVHRKTIEKDMRRLEELGLYARQITSWQGYNLTSEESNKASAAMKQAKADRNAAQSAKPLPSKGCYLTPAESYLTPAESCLAPQESYLTPSENAETVTQQAFEPIEAPDQTIHTFSDSTDSGGVDLIDEEEQQEKDTSTTLQENRDTLKEMRRLGIEDNVRVRAVMRKYAHNVSNALAHIKQRYNNQDKFGGNITGAFVKALKTGAKPERSNKPRMPFNPPTIAQMEALELALITRSIVGFGVAPYGEDSEATLVDTGKAAVWWWEYLKS